MAKRPIFIPVEAGTGLFYEKSFDFKWYSGFAPIQKKRNIHALHNAAALAGFSNILEVSTKSENHIGQQLSAFNLTLHHNGHEASLEALFQGSKVFDDGGPFIDLYKLDGRAVKRDQRLKNSGRLKRFEYESEEFPLTPKSAFYDWLYFNAVYRRENLWEELSQWDAFSDIEFNPAKSINCQARSCAIISSMLKRNIIHDAIESFGNFVEISFADSI